MAGYNKVILVGNVGTKPELQHTSSGVPAANFRLATNERRKDKDGQWTTVAQWHSISCYHKLAETVAEHLQVGDTCLVEGSIRSRKLDNGNWYTDILARRIHFLPRAKEEQKSHDDYSWG